MPFDRAHTVAPPLRRRETSVPVGGATGVRYFYGTAIRERLGFSFLGGLSGKIEWRMTYARSKMFRWTCVAVSAAVHDWDFHIGLRGR